MKLKSELVSRKPRGGSRFVLKTDHRKGDRPYHRFVFDPARRAFVGRFEAMYRAEDREGFDSWFQNDLTHLGPRVALAILDRYQFRSVLDIGCGKGFFTHLLKKVGNRVVGVDLSPTAIRKARASYRDVEFRCLSADRALRLPGRWDLIVLSEILSYVEDWAGLLHRAARKGRWTLISLYLPESPMGYIKSFSDLRTALEKYFTLEADALVNGSQWIVLARARGK